MLQVTHCAMFTIPCSSSIHATEVRAQQALDSTWTAAWFYTAMPTKENAVRTMPAKHVLTVSGSLTG